jgi:hypothetical protein
MPMKVTDFRLSSVWVEGLPQLLGRQDFGPLGPIIRIDKYAALFNALLTRDDHNLVTLPWPRRNREKLPSYNNFWDEYVVKELRDSGRGDTGIKAWRAVVPLRHKGPLVRINRTERCFVEGWYYPHGVAVTVTAWFRGRYDTRALGTAASDFLRNPMSVTWRDGSAQMRTLNSLAETCLDMLRQTGFGAVPGGHRPIPIRVITIVAAEADPGDEDDATGQSDVLRGAISAVDGNPAVEIKPAKDVYATPRFRVIWRPDRALSPTGKIHTLGCLHRNVLMPTLQVASLLRGAELLRASLANPDDAFPPRVEPYARATAGLIGRINGDPAKPASSKPWLREQIAVANANGTIDDLRAEFSMLEIK